MICPNQCVCQHSPFMDLSISRWIQALKGDKTHSAALKTSINNKGSDGDDDDALTAVNDNETFFDDDTSHLENTFVKFVMCWLQASGTLKQLSEQLPLDVQALVLLHNGNAEANFTGKSNRTHCARWKRSLFSFVASVSNGPVALQPVAHIGDTWHQ